MRTALNVFIYGIIVTLTAGAVAVPFMSSELSSNRMVMTIAALAVTCGVVVGEIATRHNRTDPHGTTTWPYTILAIIFSLPGLFITMIVMETVIIDSPDGVDIARIRVLMLGYCVGLAMATFRGHVTTPPADNRQQGFTVYDDLKLDV